MHSHIRYAVAAIVLVAGAPLVASDPGTNSWPMWGGTPDRNMVSAMKNVPTEWDVKTKKNIKWVADVGSQSYGNPVVADGMVFIGTNNEGMRDPKQGGDRGVLMAFSATDGTFVWQHTHPKLESGRAGLVSLVITLAPIRTGALRHLGGAECHDRPQVGHDGRVSLDDLVARMQHRPSLGLGAPFAQSFA